MQEFDPERPWSAAEQRQILNLLRDAESKRSAAVDALVQRVQETTDQQMGRLEYENLVLHQMAEAAREVADLAPTLRAFIDDPAFHQACTVLHDRLAAIDVKRE